MVEYKYPYTAFFWPRVLTHVRKYVRSLCSPASEVYWNEHLQNLVSGHKTNNTFELIDAAHLDRGKERYLLSVKVTIEKVSNG